MSGVVDDKSMGLGDHIDELRGRLIRCVVVLVAFAVVAFVCKDLLMQVILAPSEGSFVTFKLLRRVVEQLNLSEVAEFNPHPVSIINTQMAGQFNMHLSISFWAALIVTFPFTLWQVWGFVRPALSDQSARSFRGGVVMVSLLFFVGVGFGYFAISPLAISFLTNYELDSSIINMIAMSSYLSTVMSISFAGGIAFQLPFLVRILSSVGLLSVETMRRYRRVAIAVIVVASALLTPPDIFSQILLALPMMALYEVSILMIKKH